MGLSGGSSRSTKKQYEVHFSHFEHLHSSKYHICAGIPGGSWLHLIKTNTKSTFCFRDREGRRHREKNEAWRGPIRSTKIDISRIVGLFGIHFFRLKAFFVWFWAFKRGQMVLSEWLLVKHRYGDESHLTGPLPLGSKIMPPDSQMGNPTRPQTILESIHKNQKIVSINHC